MGDAVCSVLIAKMLTSRLRPLARRQRRAVLQTVFVRVRYFLETLARLYRLIHVELRCAGYTQW